VSIRHTGIIGKTVKILKAIGKHAIHAKERIMSKAHPDKSTDLKEEEKRLERKAKQKEYQQTPEYKAKAREYQREYRKKPENKTKQREYQKEYQGTPENKAKQREYQKEYQKEYQQRPEVKAKASAKAKAKAREYQQRPEVKAQASPKPKQGNIDRGQKPKPKKKKTVGKIKIGRCNICSGDLQLVASEWDGQAYGDLEEFCLTCNSDEFKLVWNKNQLWGTKVLVSKVIPEDINEQS